METTTETRLQGKSETTAIILGVITALLLAAFFYMLATRGADNNVQTVDPNAAGGLTIEDVNNAETTQASEMTEDSEMDESEAADMDDANMEDMDDQDVDQGNTDMETNVNANLEL